MFVGLFVLAGMPANDIFGIIAIFLAVEAYSIVAALFVLVGIRYLLGPRSWIDGLAERCAGRVATFAVLGGLAVGVCWLLAVL